MGAQQTLQTNIVINAKTGNGFSKLGNTLTEMGSLVNGFSQQLISLGEDSVEVYRSYEKSLKSAEVALSTTYGRGTAELAKVMKQLDASATDWAATTIFHTNDVGNAISMAAHAGWDLDEILSGLPAAMQLAQAGGLDLSEAVNYIVKSTSAAGIAFEDLNDFTDLWTYAANRSASDIREFGDAMLRMGGTMRFAGDTEELMTLIAVTANAGAVGAEAGTMIRNSMLRLLAPTEKAEKAMAMLGAASQETVGLLQDEELAAANAILERQGFSAYDEAGNLKNILQVYRELYVALGEIAGGYDNIERNQDAIAILSAIFPTRTITEALNLLRGARDSYDGLYEDMKAGAAEGYGEYAAETMMDGLDGRIEIFESKIERLKQVIGGELSEDVISVTDLAGSAIDNLAEMNPAGFSALVRGGEVLAGLGPALLGVGAAVRLIGMLGIHPLLAVGAAALAGGAALADYKQSLFESNFGNMELNHQQVESYIQSIGANLREGYADAENFRAAVQEALTDYETASGSLSSILLSDVLTKASLTEDDQAEIMRLADEMYQSLSSAILFQAESSESYWRTLLQPWEADKFLKEIVSLTEANKSESLQQAEEISQELRNALFSAFADGKITQEEYEKILSLMREMDEVTAKAVAEAKSEEDYVNRRMLLHKAQTLGFDEMESLAAEASEQQADLLARQEEEFLRERFRLEYLWDQAIANGGTIEGKKATEEGKAASLAAADRAHEEEKARTAKEFDEFIMDLFYAAMMGSDLFGDYETLVGISEQWRSGELFADDAMELLEKTLGNNYSNQTKPKWMALADPSRADTLALATEAVLSSLAPSYYDENAGHAYSSDQAMLQKIQMYKAAGDEEMANKLLDFYLPWLLLSSGSNIGSAFGTLYTNTQGHEGILGLAPYGTNAAEPSGSITELPSGLKIYTGDQIPDFIEIPVEADTRPAEEAIDGLNGQEVTVSVSASGVIGYAAIWNKMVRYANGGRATAPSIFGDDGAEWAIPEEHTERTAGLLNAARAASGWSWYDLLSRFGGLNADAAHVPTTLVYSPTIHAENAEGMDRVLRADKRRMEKWMREQRMRNAAEVYA